MIGLGVTMVMNWYPGLMGGNPDVFCASNWTMAKLVLDMFDETSDVYSLVTQEDQYNVKPMMVFTLILGGDGMMKIPGFSWDAFGNQGQLLVDAQSSFNYEEHAPVAIGLYSCVTPAIFGSAQWMLTMQFGRVQDAIQLCDENLVHTEKVVANTGAGYVHSFMWTCGSLAEVYTVLGLSQHVAKTYTMMGLSFDSVEDRIAEVTKHDDLFQPMEQEGPGNGLMPLRRCAYHIKSLCILNMNVPEANAKAWLESLPDDEVFVKMSVTMEGFDFGAQYNGMYHTCWIALAHEKVGMYDGALRFANLALEQDMAKAGNPNIKWTQVIAWACKGRVLAKLDRHDEALAAFQSAITVSKESYHMMEAFAYRELANFAEGGDAAAQAATDLDAKLAVFESRMTRAEFDGLKIAP